MGVIYHEIICELFNIKIICELFNMKIICELFDNG